MYCRKCGKWIDGDAQLCEDCRAESAKAEQAYSAPKSAAPENPYYNAPAYSPAPAPAQPQTDATDSIMYSFGKALTSTILGIVSFIFACVSYAGIAVAVTSSWAMYVIMTIISLTGMIISFVFGPSSIKAFISQKNAGKKKPIPALVLGIIGTVWASISALYLSIGFIVLITVI